MDITELIRIISGGLPLTPPMPKLPEKGEGKIGVLDILGLAALSDSISVYIGPSLK